MIDHEVGVCGRLQEQAVHVNHFAPDLRAGVELTLAFVNAPLVGQEQP
jgi:hypothetical protein